MSFIIATAISDLQLKTSTVGDRISDDDFILAFNDADEYFRSTYKMPTSERSTDLLVFNGVRENPMPSDFLGMMSPRRPYDQEQVEFKNTTADEFVFYPNGRATAIKWQRETPFLLVEDNSGTRTQIDAIGAPTDNGSWAVSGDGTSLSQDSQIYSYGSSSLRWTSTFAGGTTTLVNSTLNSVDLSSYTSKGYIFVDLRLPSSNTAALTSVRLRYGSDLTNYYQVTSTTRYRGDSILNSWGLIGFDLSTATTTGTPVDTAIDYVQLVFTHGSSNGTWNVDNLFAALPTYFELPYYSSANFKTSANAYISRATATTDTVLCPTGSDNAYKYKAMELVCMQKLQDSGLANYAQQQLKIHEIALMSQYPNQQAQVTETWYRI